MRKESHKYDITQCALYKKKSSKQLKKVLCITEEEYKDILSIVHYHSFQIDKKDSTEKRNITAPDKRIKEIQTRILKLLQNVERPTWLISGEKGKCYIDNGKSHLNSDYFLTMDIKKFYDNCSREYVFLFFKNRLMMAGDLAGLCTDIVTYDGGIPTGCPTSQIIAYYAYENMFNEIYKVACKYGCKYTVYVDDMTFSSKEPFDLNRMRNEVDCILRKYGHKPKYNADVKTVQLAALLHDVDDIKLSPDTYATKKNAVDFMSINKIDGKRIEAVCKIIDEVSFAGADSVVPDTIEGKCVQDADRLDAIGAIGIARTFAYGGSNGRKIYDPEINPKMGMNKEEYRNNQDSTSINHFYEKLLLLKDMMNTTEGRKLAEHRQAVMQEFLDEFMIEWEGKM